MIQKIKTYESELEVGDMNKVNPDERRKILRHSPM